MMTHGHVPYYRQPSSNIIEQRFCHFFCVHSKPAKPGNERVTAKQMLHCRYLDGSKDWHMERRKSEGNIP